MKEQEYIIMLYDYYGDLFNDKQKAYFEDYYFDNLTMEEIADNNGISKNAVSKSLIEVKNKLNDYESKLNLYSNYLKIKDNVDDETLEIIKNYI